MLRVFPLLFVNEMRTLLRERISLFWIFLFPIVFLAIMMVSYGGGAMLAPVRIEALDLDRSAASTAYVAEVRRVFALGDPIAGSVEAVSRGTPPHEEAIRFTVPRGFGAGLAAGRKVAVTLDYVENGSIATQVAARIFPPLTTRFNATRANAPMLVSVRSQASTAGRHLIDFSQYLLTGVLVVAIMSAAISSTSITVAARREQNTFKLMACLPISPIGYLVAIVAARVIILLLASALLLVAGRYLFGIDISLAPGDLANALLLVLCGSVSLISLGLMMSARVRSVPAAIFMANLVYLSLLIVSDLTIPLRGLPDGVRMAMSVLPTTELASGLRAALVQQQPLAAQGVRIAILLGWAALFLGIARLTFRWHRA